MAPPGSTGGGGSKHDPEALKKAQAEAAKVAKAAEYCAKPENEGKFCTNSPDPMKKCLKGKCVAP